ncbi:hypothetical protein GIB67_030286 [Kingdonia uniflora]|uniref:HMA domain-containing protein n=1 Tax=Kingdonia uniflora TaxID=39325 RepID=A0A7J7M6I6_9MAGN|nr:hypothetical protein GIB67_030286 [Kingdonia uniflora]
MTSTLTATPLFLSPKTLISSPKPLSCSLQNRFSPNESTYIRTRNSHISIGFTPNPAPISPRFACAGVGDVSNGGETKLESVADAIILDVRGMMCEGCTSSVKRILESQPQVLSASVNLAEGAAYVWSIPEAKVAQNWQQLLGETLAKHLTNCGFKSNLQVHASNS